MNIHPTAIVEDGADLGLDVIVGPFAYVANHTRIGDGCHLGPHVVIHPFTTLGPECRVHAGAVLGDVPQDVSFQSVRSFVKVGARCTIREGMTIHRGTAEDTVTRVGDDCFLMAFSHVAHNVEIGDRVILANNALVAGYARVGDRAFISGNTVTHQFTSIGRLAMLSGGSGVGQDLPPFCITRPMSANQVMGLNQVGMRRAGFTVEERDAVKRAFLLWYRSGLTIPEAVHALETTFTDGPGREFLEFVKASARGVCGMGPRKKNRNIAAATRREQGGFKEAGGVSAGI